jgi:hypothetical protein
VSDTWSGGLPLIQTPDDSEAGTERNTFFYVRTAMP